MAGLLNKKLYTDITRLKLLNVRSQPKFILDQSPFKEDDDEDELTAGVSEKDIVIVVRIFPDSDIYNQGAYQIEIKLTATFPFDPPEVHFITQIYHPNIASNGRFCHELLDKQVAWRFTASLVDVVKAVTTNVDNPNISYSERADLAREYMENKSEFDRKAMEYVRKYALPRS